MRLASQCLSPVAAIFLSWPERKRDLCRPGHCSCILTRPQHDGRRGRVRGGRADWRHYCSARSGRCARCLTFARSRPIVRRRALTSDPESQSSTVRVRARRVGICFSWNAGSHSTNKGAGLACEVVIGSNGQAVTRNAMTRNHSASNCLLCSSQTGPGCPGMDHEGCRGGTRRVCRPARGVCAMNGCCDQIE